MINKKKLIVGIGVALSAAYLFLKPKKSLKKFISKNNIEEEIIKKDNER